MSFITNLFYKAPPHPDFSNVEPAGTGWYKYSRDSLFGPGKWRRVEGLKAYDPGAKWLDGNRLKELALDAAISARRKAER
mgnify:CR=1 FL=1